LLETAVYCTVSVRFMELRKNVVARIFSNEPMVATKTSFAQTNRNPESSTESQCLQFSVKSTC